jgi:hypothetical protein
MLMQVHFSAILNFSIMYIKAMFKLTRLKIIKLISEIKSTS